MLSGVKQYTKPLSRPEEVEAEVMRRFLGFAAHVEQHGDEYVVELFPVARETVGEIPTMGESSRGDPHRSLRDALESAAQRLVYQP